MLIICNLLSKEKRATIDLRDEVEILKKLYDKETMAASKEENYNPGEVIDLGSEIEMRMCSYGNNSLTADNSRDTWLVDGNYIFVLNEEKGLFKLSKGAEGKMPGQIEAFNADFAKSDSSMMIFDGKIFIRYKELKDRSPPVPFVMVDKNTLKEIKMDPELKFEPKEEDNHSLLWSDRDEETGRSLMYTPLITDGQYIYVIAR